MAAAAIRVQDLLRVSVSCEGQQQVSDGEQMDRRPNRFTSYARAVAS